MAFELMTEGGLAPDWVANLSPGELRANYNELVRQRAARQKEQLHIQVSAAAVVADGGKMAKAQESALSDAATRTTVRSEPAGSEKPKTLDEAARVQRDFDETAHLWKS